MTKSVNDSEICYCCEKLAFVVAATFSSHSPEFDTIPEEFTLSVTKFRKRFFFFVFNAFIHQCVCNIYMFF